MRKIMTSLQQKVRVCMKLVVTKATYQKIAWVVDTIELVRKGGFGVLKNLRRPAAEWEKERWINIPGYEHNIVFRPGTKDVGTIIQNLIREEYGKLKVDVSPKVVIDAGGYIGDVSIYYLNRYKNSKVYMLEPNPEAIKLARKNLKHYDGRIEIVEKALWKEDRSLKMNGVFTGAKLSEKDVDQNGIQIKCISMKSLIERYAIKKIDLLKMDIEGAEEAIITENANWLDNVKTLVVEYHGKNIKEKCDKELRQRGFVGHPYRSLFYYSRENN